MQRNHCWVVAFCFGTEECCITFSFNHEPLAVKAVRIQRYDHVSANEKFPLAILLNKRNEFDSFGCEAQRRYKDISTKDSDTWWFFKSVSNINKTAAEMTVNDAKGRAFPFETLMEILIEHMGRHLNSLLADIENGVDVAVIEQGFDEAFRVTFLGNRSLDPLQNALKRWLKYQMGLPDVDIDRFDESFREQIHMKAKRAIADWRIDIPRELVDILKNSDKLSIKHGGKLFLTSDQEGMDRNVKLKSIDGQEQRAMPIFSMAIEYLKREAMKQINETTDGLRDTDVLFVITVPAIWNDSAKQFMREAAIQAGIENECILLALEPEAATSWCKRKQEEIDPKGPLSKKDANIMVVDVGGLIDLINIKYFKKTEKGGIKLIQKPEGGAWGGTAVDKTFLRFLDEVFGQEAIEKLRDEALVEYYEILTTFEVQKRDSNIESLTLHVPTLIDITGEQNLMENINSLGFQNDVKILKKRGKRIRIGRN
ncbi:HS12A-like protein, partial [Mya arenaria]